MDNNTVIKRFNENISYLKTYHKNVFDKLVAFDNAVIHGHYREKYELVYENGYFDVVEKTTGEKLYNTDSYQYAKNAAESIEYNLDDNVFITGFDNKISKEDVESCSDFKPFEYNLQGMAPLRYYMQEQLNSKTALTNLYKFVFFGSGLGLQIESIDKKISAKVYLIVEDDLELFRLSLFVTDYRALSKRATLYFSVFEDDLEFSQTANAFLEEKYYYNLHIKYFHTLNHTQEKLQQFHLTITSQSHLRFFYNDLLVQNLLPTENLFQKYQFLNNKVSVKSSSLEDKPFLLIAAGPSLDKNIEWLKNNQDSFVIVALSAILSRLERENIKPDIIVHLDVFKAAIKHFDKVRDFELFKDAVCIFSAKTPPVITARFKKENIFFFENGTDYIESSFRPSAPCVGSIAYQILLYLQVEKLYLLGLDLAIDSKTGKTHSDSHQYGKSLDVNDNAFEQTYMDYKEHLVSVTGNKEEVLTTPHFKASIDAINDSTKRFKQDVQKVYNFGDGAKFDDVNPLKIEECTEQSILKDSTDILEVFRKYLVQNLEENEKKSLQYKVEHAQHIKSLLTAFSKKKKFPIDELRDRIIALVKECSKDLNNDLNRVYDLFFRYMLPYIFDFLNKKDSIYDKKSLLDVRDMLVKELFAIVKYYISHIEIALNDEGEKEIKHSFIASLFQKRASVFENSYNTNSIGFLVYDENSENNNFLTYIEELYRKFPYIDIKALCFSELQKNIAQEKFQKEGRKFEAIVIHELEEVEQSVAICICNLESSVDKVMYDKLRKNNNIFALKYDTRAKKYTVNTVSEAHGKWYPLRIEPEILNFTKEEITQQKGNAYRLFFEPFLGVLDDTDSIYEINSFRIIDHLLENKEFREFYKNYLYKEVMYIELKNAR